jgi:uncharacterized protein YjbI with pentapeptide repeats
MNLTRSAQDTNAISGGTRAVANAEHLALLRQGAAIWNEWRTRNPYSSPDLTEANLRGTRLEAANLREANLSAANLREASLIRAILSVADLSAADLTKADLGGAIVRRAKLVGTNLQRAHLPQADLRGTNLVEADLRLANLRRANLRGANLTRARLRETNFADIIALESTVGLEDCEHRGPSILDFRTVAKSGTLPIAFLRGCGLPDILIEYLPSFRGNAIQFYSCFISYSSKDQVFAERLHADLQNKGVRCWFAPHDLRVGDKIWDAIDEAIRLKDKLLVILSEASIASDWVEDEVTNAYEEERERKVTLLFPIRIDDAVANTPEPWARKLRARHIGDFRQWEKPAEYQKSLERLLRDLKASGAQ